MVLGFRSLSLALLSATLLVGCARSARPDTSSAVEHETQAAKLERSAGVHEGYVRAAGRYNVRYNPSHKANAEAARKHAEMHRAQAESLRKSEVQECAGTNAEARTQCPMVHVDKAEDTTDGVVLWLSGEADAGTVAQLMSCHIAHARTQGHKGMDGCPFYVPGVAVAPVEGQKAVRLTISDPKAVETLQSQMHQMAE